MNNYYIAIFLSKSVSNGADSKTIASAKDVKHIIFSSDIPTL